MKSAHRPALLCATVLLATGTVHAAAPATGDADARARALVAQMTPEERITMLHGIYARPDRLKKPLPEGAIPAAGYVPGIPRLGIPALKETDASLGIAYLSGLNAEGGTALPSSLSLASTWDTSIASAGSAMIAQEARDRGFNVLLAGGVNLVREPRNGRNFEYLGEDPLLAGVLAGETIRAIQEKHVLSTVKHFVLNAQETGRHILSANIREAALRESDLLAFQLAIERGRPWSVMSAYNKINGAWASENAPLLNGVLKGDWQYPGFVMSDWGGVHGIESALKGLDQQSGEDLDLDKHYANGLLQATQREPAYASRVADMNRRIVRAMLEVGLFDHPPQLKTSDTAANVQVARTAAEAGIVLLKNNGLLPLGVGTRKIAVIGGYANLGVMSGGGSSQVAPKGGPALSLIVQGNRTMYLHPSPPLAAITARAGNDVVVTFNPGAYPDNAAALARRSDVAVVFATQYTTEGLDVPSLALPNGQDALIAAVAAANPRTVVVLETGGPVRMPWLDQVAAVVQAWYPGIGGGPAIASVLYGDVNPSGRLPVTFPVDESQLPRPVLDGLDTMVGDTFLPERSQPPFDVNYDIEGSDVGYRWYARRGLKPLFPFGFGLSYTRFAYSDLKVAGGKTLTATLTITNTGQRAGTDTPQFYLQSRRGTAVLRLIGWSRVALQPGESRTVTISADPRLLADWDEVAQGWRIDAGDYLVSAGASSADQPLRASARVIAQRLKP